MKLRKISYFVPFIIIVLIFSACGTSVKVQNQLGQTMNEKESNIKDTPEKEPNHTQAEIPKPEPIVRSIELSAVGEYFNT